MDKLAQIKNKYNQMSKVAKASMWFVICGFLQRGISVITTPIFTRLLSTGEYGSYSVFNSWLEIVTILATLKLGSGVYIQGLVKFSDDQDRFSSSMLGLASTWWAISFAIYLLTHDFWNELLGLSTYMMICMFVMMLATDAFNFWAARQRNQFNYITLVKITLFTSVLKPVTGIIGVLLTENYKVEARITMLAVVELLLYAGLYIRIMKKGKQPFSKEYWKYALKFNLPLIPHFLSQVILNHSDRIMIKHLVGYSESGIYSLAYSLAMILSMLNTSIQNAMRPWVFQKLKARQEREIQPVIISAILIVALCNLVLIAFAPELVAFFAPSSYKGATSLIPPITMAVFFAFMYNLFVDIQMYFEKTKSVMIVACVCAVLNIVTNYIFIGKYGYVAAAYTTLISYMLMAGLHYIGMKRVLRKQKDDIIVYDLKLILACSTIFLMLGTVLGVLKDYFAFRVALIVVGVIVIYLNRTKLKVVFEVVKKNK